MQSGKIDLNPRLMPYPNRDVEVKPPLDIPRFGCNLNFNCVNELIRRNPCLTPNTRGAIRRWGAQELIDVVEDLCNYPFKADRLVRV